MSVRRVDFARLESAGWTVTIDSPWRRLGQLLVRVVRRVVDSNESTAEPVGGWSR
jgi:hypothetical protein